VVDALRDKDYGVIKDMGEITAVGLESYTQVRSLHIPYFLKKKL
jgi:hypothetical protein